MKITKKWLNKNRACLTGIQWFDSQNETDAKKVLRSLLKQNHFDWANWTVVRLMTSEQKIRYAIYAAEKVLSVYESQYPDNKAPRNAIKLAKKYLKNPSEENKTAARAAYAAASCAAYYAADAASCVAYAVTRAAEAAYYAAKATHATYAVNATASAASCAAACATARAVTHAAEAAYYAAIKNTIIEYGIKLISKDSK